MKKAFLGIIISVAFLYFSFSGVGYIDIAKSLANVEPYFLFQALFFFIVISVLKSIRWGLILSPVKKLGQRKLFPVTCVGNMAVILFPFRMGEFVKPYLISNSDSIPLSTSLATVFVERIMDSLCIFFIAICIFIVIDIPEWLINTGYNFLIILIILISALFFLYINTKLGFNFLKPFSKFISDKFTKKIADIFNTFSKGLGIISDFQKITLSAFLSVLIWVCTALAIYSLYSFQGLILSFESAFVVLIILSIGVSVPAAPGFLGNFQFACILALSLFNVTKPDAVSFSIIYYIVGFGINIILGLFFIPYTGFSLRNIQRYFSKAKDF